MNETPDSDLLRTYAESHSEAAFAELVRRYVDLVHSAARRLVRDAHLAEDVTQAVFVALAGAAPRLVDHPVLSGWLHRTARNIAAQTVRADVRRRAREQEAATMEQLLSPESQPDWEQVAPVLDAALGELNDADRDAVLLRYFEKKTAPEMAGLLGISHEAAQKRVNRAVERLRRLLARRGITVGAGGIAAAIASNAVQAAPAGLAAQVCTTAASVGAAISTSVALVSTKTIVMTTLQKILIGATVALCVGVSVHQAFQASQLRDQVGAMQRERDAAAEEGRKLREANDALQRKLAGMQADLQTAQEQKSEAPAAKPDPAVDAMVAWMDRVDRLKQRVKEHPEASIPEMQWLSEQDWLNAAHNKLDTDDEYRRALSNLRSSAENRFELKAFPALQKYLNEHDGKFPTDLSQLQPYFESPIDPAILAHWKIAPAAEVPNLVMGGDWIITQTGAVDEEYDSIMGMGARGYGSAGSGFDPAMKTLQSIAKAYAAANPGREPTGLADMLPYATTPEQRTALVKQIEKQADDPQFKAISSVLKAYVAANPGRFPKDISELAPYALTAEQQDALKHAQSAPPGKM